MTSRYVLPWPPSVNTYYRHVGSRVLISKAGREYRDRVWTMMLREKRHAGRVRMTIHAYPPDRRKRDLDNVLKASLDALEQARVIENDSLIDDLRIVREEPIPSGRLVVVIEPMGEL